MPKVTESIRLDIPAGATTTQTSPDFVNNFGARGVHVVLKLTVNAGGLGSVTLNIEGKDKASGDYYTLLAGAAVTTLSTNVYRVFPLATPAANLVANNVLPEFWRIRAVANNANPLTYTVGASTLA